MHMNMLVEFLEEKQKKAKFVGFVAALCALFMSVSSPILSQAKTALAVIQLFWLVLLTFGLTSLFFDFIKAVWKNQKTRSKKYDLPFDYVFSISLGCILGAVIFNLWSYMALLYTDILATLLVSLGLPMGTIIGAMLLMVFVEKHKNQFTLFSQILIISFALGFLTGSVGMYTQVALTKMYYFYWLSIVAPAATLLFFVIVVAINLFRKQKLFS